MREYTCSTEPSFFRFVAFITFTLPELRLYGIFLFVERHFVINTYSMIEKSDQDSGKQPLSMQLTSGSGEQTFHEVAMRLNKVTEYFALLSYSYCITVIQKPADISETNHKYYYTR